MDMRRGGMMLAHEEYRPHYASSPYRLPDHGDARMRLPMAHPTVGPVNAMEYQRTPSLVDATHHVDMKRHSAQRPSPQSESAAVYPAPSRLVRGASDNDQECCTSLDQRITRYLDEGDEASCSSADFVVPEGLTPEETIAFKKARRKEQCRVNQANYRKRKRAVEQQMDREIVALKDEIRVLTSTRNHARSKPQRNPSPVVRAPMDPMHIVNEVFLQLGRRGAVTHEPVTTPQQPHVDSIVGLQYEQFSTVDELTAQWKCYAWAFDVFDVRLVSVHGAKIGESLVLTAHASLRSSIYTRGNSQTRSPHASAAITCSVVQRFVFDGSHGSLAVIISEVDWIAGLGELASASRISRIKLAAELVAASTSGSPVRKAVKPSSHVRC